MQQIHRMSAAHARLAMMPALVLLAACAPMPPADGADGANGGTAVAELRVDRASYRPGDPIRVTLVNRSDDSIGYNLCVTALDRRNGATWNDASLPLAEACTMELRTLAPGATADFDHTLPTGITAGDYRVRTAVEAPLGGSRVGVASGAFRIAP